MADEDIFVLEESTTPVYDIIPEDTILEAKVAKVVVETTKMIDEDTKEPVKQVVFTFNILDEPYNKTDDDQQRKAWGRTSTKFTTHEKCRLRQWVTEIMAVDALPPKFKLDLQSLVGQQCRIVMEVDSYRDKKATPNEDGEYPLKEINRVKQVIRSRSARRPAAEEEPF